MTEQTKEYQITLLFPPSFNQETLDQAIQKTKKLITDQGGSFSQETKPTAQLKKLSYPINKHGEAFYLTYNLSLSVLAIDPLKQELNLNKDLIRYLITNKAKTKEIPKPAIDYSKMVEKVEKMEPELTKKPTPFKKITKSQIEDLDKKLEEILNE